MHEPGSKIAKQTEAALSGFGQFEGMLGKLDAAVMVVLLNQQAEAKISGDIAEFGVYKGRSASLFAHYLEPGETLHLADVQPYLETEKLEQMTLQYRFYQLDSAKFIDEGLAGKATKSYRMIHSDGSHRFDNVYNDIVVADQLLSEDGILILDDYYNPYYPQVAAAVYTYIAKETTDLGVFLVGSNKCYLCRQPKRDSMISFIASHLPENMEQLDTPVTIAKTDRNEDFDAVSFVGQKDGEKSDPIYGESLYGHYLKR